MHPLLAALVDLLVPPRRAERLVRRLTPEALAALETEQGLPYGEPAVAALVWELKYFGSAHAAALAAAMLAPRIALRAAEEVGVPLLIPVPMHPARRRERGHNQTELLCAALAERLPGLEHAPGALVRLRDTPHQQRLLRAKRLTNVKNSMRAHGVQGRICIVVDDVTTTGATLAECERALRTAGARSVHTIALAYR